MAPKAARRLIEGVGEMIEDDAVSSGSTGTVRRLPLFAGLPPPDFCLLTPNLGDDISGTKTGSHVDPAESDLDFADALLRRPEPARQKRRTAPRPRRLCEPPSPSEEARADEALLLRLLAPLRGLARGLLRSGLRLRLCFLRHSALLAMMRLAMPCSRESSCTAR